MIAVVCEIVWASTLKMTGGYSQLWPSVFNAVILAINTYFISLAVKSLPVAIAYPIWTGLGGVGVAIGAVIFFDESLGIFQILCILLIILGVIGLEATKSEEAVETSNSSVEVTNSVEGLEPIKLDEILNSIEIQQLVEPIRLE
ncbi:multidrug efflux SMR transporter [Symplocastrum sp. BBK-W-15]|uniref:Multidrug efflux SMR transporter n=2 Tax=Limnofasciculus TaxID=3064905 RepID=A0AAE3KRV7_9CYAN|nr:multidrug efflux SMR transporter [Limnofasciculus baicalensis BBK-W-15]